MPSKQEAVAAARAIQHRWWPGIDWLTESSAVRRDYINAAVAGLRAAEKVRNAAFKAGKVGRKYYIEVPVPNLCESLEPKVRRAKKGR